MNLLRKMINLLSSKVFLIWLIAIWVVSYVSYAVWSKEAFAFFMIGLRKNPAIQIPYAVFLLSLLLNIIRGSVSRFKKRGLFYLSLWIILPAGIFVFLAGYFISGTLRQSQWLLIGEGDIVKPAWSDKGYAVRKIIPSLKEETLNTEMEAGIFAYEPKVILSSREKDFEVGAFPPKKIDGTYYHILNFGLAPSVRLSDKKGLLNEGYTALRILPPPSEDSFEMPAYPYRFSIRLAPERILKKGDLTAKLYSLKSPSYEVVVYKGQDIIFEGSSKEGINFDGLTLTFFDLTYWVLLDIVKNPGIIAIIVGLFLISFGIPLRVIGFVVRVRGNALK